MSTAEQAVRDDEANVLFRGLEDARGLILAVSGGPDSTALLVLAARWAKASSAGSSARRSLSPSPSIMGCAPEAAREAAAVKRLAKNARRHRIARCAGAARKPKSGLQESRPHRALSAAGATRGARRLCPYPDRAYARRSGGDDPVPSRARQRPGRACRHGACCAAAGRRAGVALSGASAARVCRKRGSSRRCRPRASPTAKTRAIAIRDSPGRGCAA